MSRSKRGAKGPGYEYWSKRPCVGMNPGAETKRLTHRLERIQGKQEIQKGLKHAVEELDCDDPVRDKDVERFEK